MRRAELIVPPATLAAAEADPMVARVLDETSEVWRNDKYVVMVRRYDSGEVMSLSIRRDDRRAIHDWRDLQQVKNDIAGCEAEAFELYPAESRLVDTSNQYWLWCLRPGEQIPAGFTERSVSDEPDPRFPTARQRPFGNPGKTR